MTSPQLIEIEKSIQNLTLSEKIWLLEQIARQIRQTTDQNPLNREDIQYDPQVRPVWEIVVEIGSKIPAQEWKKVPQDLSKNFDHYQS